MQSGQLVEPLVSGPGGQVGPMWLVDLVVPPPGGKRGLGDIPAT